jgi:ribulose-5-phosphate 4-epimerase/fuculose-1-phosphate aldolase
LRSEPVPGGEQTARRDLAALCRLIAHFGWTELIFNHVTLRAPSDPHHYLMNPFGLHYSEVTPDSVIKVDAAGTLAEPSGYLPNPSGFALHGLIHEARPEVHCIAHVHTTAICAVGMKAAGLDHDSFYGAQLSGRIGYHPFEGLSLSDGEKTRVLDALGDRDVLILANHGASVCAADVPRAFLLLWQLQRAAEIQCAASAIPGDNLRVSDTVRAGVTADFARYVDGAARLSFDAMVRAMDTAARSGPGGRA